MLLLIASLSTVVCPIGELPLNSSHCMSIKMTAVPETTGPRIWPAGWRDGLPCAVGTMATSVGCVQCKPGTAQAAQGAVSCPPCPGGRVAPDHGMHICVLCRVGTLPFAGERCLPCSGTAWCGPYDDCVNCTTAILEGPRLVHALRASSGHVLLYTLFPSLFLFGMLWLWLLRRRTLRFLPFERRVVRVLINRDSCNPHTTTERG